MVRAFLRLFHHDETGQDLSEWCLITAVIALVALGIFIHLSGGMQSIWNTAGTTLATQNSSTPAGGAGVATASSPDKR